jgi:hypothetical protein
LDEFEACSQQGAEDGPASTDLGVQHGDSQGDQLLQWHAAGLYMSALLRLSALYEQAGAAEDAARSLREAALLAQGLGCSALAAYCHAQLAWLASERGDTEAAQQQLSAARAHAAAACTGSEVQVVTSLVQAAVHLAEGAAAGHDQRWQAAVSSFEAAAGLLQLRGAASSQPDAELLHASYCKARVRLHIQWSACLAGQGSQAEASALLKQALAEPKQQGSSPWAAAALQLQLARLSMLQVMQRSDPKRRMQVAGFRAGSGHLDLHAEFAGALDAADDSSKAASKPGGSKRSTKAAASSSRGRRGTAGAPDDAAAAAAASPEAWLASLLQLLPGCQHAPQRLRQLSMLLCDACMQLGLLHSTALFLQLSLGELPTCLSGPDGLCGVVGLKPRIGMRCSTHM